MDWRIIAAAVTALGVLASGTLLAAQVQGDLDAGVEEQLRDKRWQPPQETPPLKLNDFKLPDSMPLEVPPGTQISPDLSKMTLPRDLDIQLPNDLDLSGLSFELPQDFELKLPPGTQFSPPGLKLPEGATIKLPDGREFRLPPGSDLKLPPELVERLLAQGLPAGTLPEGRDIKLAGLPAGLSAQLDPPRFDGGGSMRLPAGTTIALPDGQRLPFAAGALGYAARYLLPAGTTFDIPFDAVGSRGGDFPLPRPHSSTQLTRDDERPRIAVETEITSMPARVRKGEPVTVSGYVRELATGRPVAGALVDVFMNETKRTPGVHVGEGVTDGSGTFTIRLTLPAEKPARDYQLVNHAVAFTDRAGRSFGDAWGDPPFATYASTTLALDLPERDGFGSLTAIGGVLQDNTGAGVPGATIVVSVDGAVVARPVTDAAGLWVAQHTFDAGTHAVSARFAGTSYYEASNVATGTIAIDDYAFEIPPVLYAKPGEGIHLAGRVLAKGSIADWRTIHIDDVFGQGRVELVSDSVGRFSYAFSTLSSQPPGTYAITYSLPEHDVQKRQLIVLNQTGRILLDAPILWDVEREIPVSITLESLAGRGVPGQEVRLTLSGPGGARELTGVTDGRGAFAAGLSPQRVAAGTYTLSARVVNSPHMSAPTVSHTLTLGSFDVEWDAPATVVRGQDVSGTATVLFAGKPFADAPVALDVFGGRPMRTDGDGVVRWSVSVPTVASLGEHKLSLSATDHPTRTTLVQVVAVPKLALDAPSSFDAGGSPVARLTLTDDQGDPIRHSAVTLTTVSAAGVQRDVVTTDGEGRWRGPINLSAVDEGNATLSARYDGGGHYLAGEDAHTMSAVTPRPVGENRLLWMLPLVGVAALGSGAAAYYFLRKRPQRVPPAEAAAAAPVVAPQLRPSDVELGFGIPAEEPAVWGVGDPLDLIARNHAQGGAFELSWAGERRTLTLAERATARTTLTFPEEGDITVTAQRQEGAYAPATAQVRIVDYRKETAREFDLFLEKARAIDPSLTSRSTPREIAWTLAGRLGAEAEPHLDEIALVLEVTNYSHYDVSRAHYLRFVRAARAIDAVFAARAGPQEG